MALNLMLGLGYAVVRPQALAAEVGGVPARRRTERAPHQRPGQGHRHPRRRRLRPGQGHRPPRPGRLGEARRAHQPHVTAPIVRPECGGTRRRRPRVRRKSSDAGRRGGRGDEPGHAMDGGRDRAQAPPDRERTGPSPRRGQRGRGPDRPRHGSSGALPRSGGAGSPRRAAPGWVTARTRAGGAGRVVIAPLVRLANRVIRTGDLTRVPTASGADHRTVPRGGRGRGAAGGGTDGARHPLPRPHRDRAEATA